MPGGVTVTMDPELLKHPRSSLRSRIFFVTSTRGAGAGGAPAPASAVVTADALGDVRGVGFESAAAAAVALVSSICAWVVGGFMLVWVEGSGTSGVMEMAC